MPEKVLRRGVVEVEALRRWGREPIGTRAVGQVVLIQHDFSSSPWVQYTLQIGKDPRTICASCLINVFTRGGDEVIRLSRYVRGVLTPFEGNLSEYALSRVVDALEGEDTPSGYQRFRVIRAEWTDALAGSGADAGKQAPPNR
jgi:hypothetical protein